MKPSNAMLDNLSNSDRLGDCLTQTGESHFIGVLGVEFLKHLVDKDSCLNVPIHTNDAIGDSFAFRAHLAVLLHFSLVGIRIGRCLVLSGVHL